MLSAWVLKWHSFIPLFLILHRFWSFEQVNNANHVSSRNHNPSMRVLYPDASGRVVSHGHSVMNTPMVHVQPPSADGMSPARSPAMHSVRPPHSRSSSASIVSVSPKVHPITRSNSASSRVSNRNGVVINSGYEVDHEGHTRTEAHEGSPSAVHSHQKHEGNRASLATRKSLASSHSTRRLQGHNGSPEVLVVSGDSLRLVQISANSSLRRLNLI